MNTKKTIAQILSSLIIAFVITACVDLYRLGTNREGLNWHLLVLIWLVISAFILVLLRIAPSLRSWLNKQRDRDIFRRNFVISMIASIFTGYLRYAVLSPTLGDKKLENSIIVAFVTFVGVFGLTFFWNITETLKRFTFTTLAEIYDGSEGLIQHGRISDGLTNAHIASLQYYNIIPSIIINDSNTYCGFVYLRRASFSSYAHWVKQLFEYDKIHFYDTMNTFPPERAIGAKCLNREAVIRIQELLRKKMPEDAKIKVQVVDIGLAPFSSESTEDKIKAWAIDEYQHIDSKLCDWLNHATDLDKWLKANDKIPFYWQFKHTLEANQYFLGEYVVLNRIRTDCGHSKPEQMSMVIRYDEDEQLMEWLLGNSNTMFCNIFSRLDQLNLYNSKAVSHLSVNSSYTDFFKIENEIIDLLKWQELLKTKLDNEIKCATK